MASEKITASNSCLYYLPFFNFCYCKKEFPTMAKQWRYHEDNQLLTLIPNIEACGYKYFQIK